MSSKKVNLEEYAESWRDHGALGSGRSPANVAWLGHVRRYREVGDSGVQGRNGLSAKPPEDSSYRCVELKVDGTRCTQWALKGQKRCRHHGGRRLNAPPVGKDDIASTAYLLRFPAVYSKHLSDSLKSRLAELQGQDKYDLTPELDLARCTALDAAKLYDVVSTLSDDEDGLSKKIAVGQVLRDTMHEVADICGKAQNVAAGNKRGVIDVQALHLVVVQMITIAHDIFGDVVPPELIEEYGERIKQIKLPRDGTEGTELTPDTDVLAMDDTIPRETAA